MKPVAWVQVATLVILALVVGKNYIHLTANSVSVSGGLVVVIVVVMWLISIGKALADSVKK